MDFAQARDRIFIHAGFQDQQPDVGLLHTLRPYIGASENDFADLLSALVHVHSAVATSQMVDRDLCAALWSICHRSRLLALRTDSAVRRNHLADDAALRVLESWIDVIESFAIRMLRGLELTHCAIHAAEVIGTTNLRNPPRFHFLLPILEQMMGDEDDDVVETAKRAITRLS